MCRFAARPNPPGPANVQPAASNVSFDDMLVDDLSEFNWWDSVEDLTFPLECGDLKAVPEPVNEASPLKCEQEADSTTSTPLNLELMELLRSEEALKNRSCAVSSNEGARPQQPAASEEALGFDNAAALGAALQAQRLHAQTQQMAAVQQLAQAAQLQLQAPLLAAMQASQAAQQLQQPNFVAGGVATGVSQVPQQQSLEQLMAAAAMGAPFGNPLVNNLPVMLSMRNLVNSKNHVELDETVEKIKKKRRESAQRSRARKNAYMKTLEVENKQLRTENNRLKEILSRMDRSFLSAAVAAEVPVAVPIAQ